MLLDFVAKFPTSSYVPEAQNRIQRIEAAIRERQNQEARQREAARQAEEQLRAEREAALRKLAEQEETLRKHETLRAQTAAEKVRKERETAQAQEDQRLKLVAEKERKEREAARAQEEQRVRIAAERERKQREEAVQLLAEQARTKIAATNPALAGISTEIRTVPPTPAAPVADHPCDRDGAVLAQLRSNPSLEGIAQLEASLTCEKLRAQVMRLRESLTSAAHVAPGIAAQVKPAIAEKIVPPPVAPKQEAAPKPPESPKAAVATVAPASSCKQDEARLARIRANPSLTDLVALERDLSCNRLRPQIVRLRESLPKEIAKETAKETAKEAVEAAKDAPKPGGAAGPPALQSAQSAPAEVKPAQPGPIVQVRSCDEERATLAKLRASQSREDVVRFERELACERLRPQVIRLRESLSGG
jgi:myosin heavy subunit